MILIRVKTVDPLWSGFYDILKLGRQSSLFDTFSGSLEKSTFMRKERCTWRGWEANNGHGHVFCINLPLRSLFPPRTFCLKFFRHQNVVWISCKDSLNQNLMVKSSGILYLKHLKGTLVSLELFILEHYKFVIKLIVMIAHGNPPWFYCRRK